ncbi:OLC1v1020878C1 [Oldenlandia corymbosa var. corymbosa]|uniref:OLC1v1020878C1 n=1 Tax=Oldenlandia corymbosa var. corymbosa TaxID=529605 RepID=A0AAV1BWN9_OLDCO|nr:OLC1v1020878C1 [Oldenlandia corymbosa var. corymbosa]
MQQQPTTLNSSPVPAPPLPFPPNSITTEQIQKCLDDNKNLILAILENQNLGKVNECAQYQAVLQRNLMYLAAIADAQPPPSTSAPPSQLPPNSNPQEGHYMQQHAQNTALQQQQQLQGGIPLQKLPFQLNAMRSDQQQQQQLFHLQAQAQQHQQQFQGQAGMHHISQAGLSNSGGLMEGRGGKQNPMDTNSGDGQGKSTLGHH